MKLIDFVNEIEELDEELIIFLHDRNDSNSDIILAYGEDGDRGEKIYNERKYYYLLEIFLAKEFINDWVESLNYMPSSEDIAKRLYEYAINDA